LDEIARLQQRMGQKKKREQTVEEVLMRPDISYLIMATPRSGSYLLCEALINTNLAGRPTEYFGPMQTRTLMSKWGVSHYAAYLTRIIEEGTTPNGVFGAKLIWQFAEDFIDHLREIPGYEKLPMPQLLATIFPGLNYIWITRRDKVRQAISFWKALQTNGWIGIEEGQLPEQITAQLKMLEIQSPRRVEKKEVHFDFKSIERLRRGLEQDEVEMQQYFTACEVQPFKVVYEDLVDSYEQTALQILEYLQIPVPEQFVFAERVLKKQANEQSEEWVQRYYQMKQKQQTEK
jgi:LPS sulfotransferase NodH